MSQIEKLRAQFPQYASISDGDLLLAVHRQFYPQMHVKDFMARVDPDDNSRFSISDKMWPYWQDQVAKPLQDETPEQTRQRVQGSLPQTDPGVLEGTARAGLKGATFGFGDEAVAAGAAALDPLVNGSGGTFSDRYENYLERERGDVERFQQTHPKTALAAELTGGVVGAGTAAGAGLTAMGGASGVRSLAARGAADGFMYGGLAGAGYAEGGPAERLAGAGAGAGAGGVIGAAATPAFAGMSALGRAMVERIARSRGTPESQAAARLRQAVTSSGLTPDDIATRLDDLGPEGMLIDTIGEEGRALARKTANLDPAAREILETASYGRMQGQPDRISDSLKRASGLDQPYTAQELQEAARRSAKPQIDAAYDGARSLGYDLDVRSFDDILGTGMGARARTEGTRLARDRMVAEAAQKGQVGDEILKNGPSNLAILDETKKSLDAVAAPALGQPQTNEQSIAGTLARTLRERIDESLPEYGGARELARGLRQREDAITLGTEGAKPRVPADFSRRVQTVDPSRRQDVAQGYASGKLDQVENRRGTPGLIDALFGSRRQQDALSSSLGEGASEVRRAIANERAFGQTHRALTGNSTTARQLSEMGAFPDTDVSLAAADMGSGALASLLARRLVPGAITRMSARNNSEVAPAVANMLRGRELPAAAAPQSPASPAMQRLLMRYLAQQGGAGASLLTN